MLSCFRRLLCLKSLIKFLTFDLDFKFFHNMTKKKFNIKQEKKTLRPINKRLSSKLISLHTF